MALSQIQCLDDNHVNPRTHESKPEFLYSEDQRLALEALLRDGRDAFLKYLEQRGLRGFLSDPELDALSGALEPYEPGSDIYPEGAEEDEPPLSLHYWPEVSDTSVPHMELGWPDSEAYRGVTRTTVYTQPPLDGQAHIKEVVRKMIAQAQKVIAVVMDVFTDVDIFRDLLDAGFKRKVSVYILLEQATLPHFLSMCQRANMHAGHLKNLRVRCAEGMEFYTRSASKVKGRMGHRFMFIDGDKAVSGSYSFTWMSSRLDRNLITVVTGQAVDAFDTLFRTLYGTSSSVNLRTVATEPEPEPEPLPQPVAVAPPSAAIARRLYNPKYALALGNPSPSQSPTPSAGETCPKKSESPEGSKNPGSKRRRRRRASKEVIQEEAPLHPGLVDLEKAYLIPYLPTWPEPDPPSDVIGFINIRDASKPTQVHLQRSEMFETSQAIRFSSPFSTPKETLPEVARPRQLSDMNKVQSSQSKTTADKSAGDRAQPAQPSAQTKDIKSRTEANEQRSPASRPKCEPDTAESSTAEEKIHSSTPSKQKADHNSTASHLGTHTPLQSSNKDSTANTGTPSNATQAVTSNNPECIPRSHVEKEAEANLNTKSAAVYRPHILENSTYRVDVNRGQHREVSQTDSHTQKPQSHSEITRNDQTTTASSHVSPSSTSNSSTSQQVSSSETNSAALSSISNSSPLNPPMSPSSSRSSTPIFPIPKPRNFQLIIKDTIRRDDEKLLVYSIARRPETSGDLLEVDSEPAVVPVSPVNEPQTPLELQVSSESQKGEQKDTENKGHFGEAPQQKRSVASQETKNEEAFGLRDDRAGMQSLAGTSPESQSDLFISSAPKAESLNSQEIIPKDVKPETLTSVDCKLDSEAGVQHVGIKAPERELTGGNFPEVPKENSNNMSQGKTYRATSHSPQRIMYTSPTAQDTEDAVDSLKTPTKARTASTHNPRMSEGSDTSTHTSAASTEDQQPAHCPDMASPNTGKLDTHTLQELTPKARGSTFAPEKPPRSPLFYTPELRPPEREPRSIPSLKSNASLDGTLPRTPTPDSQTHTPGPRSITPDFRTPTPDISDGYVTPRTDSAPSTNSDEYYECCDSPLHGPGSDRAGYTLAPNATSTTASPPHINCKTALSGTRNLSTSSSETVSLSDPGSLSSLSSLLDVKGKEEEKTGDEKGRKPRTTEGEGIWRRASEETEGAADHCKPGKDLTETVDVDADTQPQAPTRKRALNQSAAETGLDSGVTQTTEEVLPKRWSTGEPSKMAEKAAGRSSSVERRGRPQSAREPQGQKIVRTPPRTPQNQQKHGSASSPSQPSRSPLALTSPRPWEARQAPQAVSKVTSPVSGEAISPRRPPSRPPPPVSGTAVGPATGRKLQEASHSQERASSRQPAAAQSRARSAQSPSRHSYPRPQDSSHLTYTNALSQQQQQPHLQNQKVSAQEGNGQEGGKSPFTFTFSRLYSLKGLKDKMTKVPAQGRKGSTSSAVQSRKSSS